MVGERIFMNSKNKSPTVGNWVPINNPYGKYSETNFPERLFVLGASPSLELLYPYREEMNEWGHWVIQHAAVVQPFLEFIQPLYNISYAGGLVEI